MAESDSLAQSTTTTEDCESTDKNFGNGNDDSPQLTINPLQSHTANQFLFRSSIFTSQFNGNQDGTTSSQKSTFVLNPSRLNPLLKPSNEASNSSNKEKNNINGAPKFLPLIQNGGKSTKSCNSATASGSSNSSSTDFVFGQNIQDRVVSESKSEELKSSSCENTNGTSNMLFSSVVKETLSADGNDLLPTSNCSKSLSESAREYEEARAIKRKYEEVEIKTGEEDEINVSQITCKLFAFDNTKISTWQERGRGTLRLNDFRECDSNASHSRLVFRTSGSFRVILNTKIWSGMTIQQASNKSIRFTALDNGEIKVFLLMGNPEDIKQLKLHLESRVKTAISRQPNVNENDDVQSNSKKLVIESESEDN